MVTRSPTRTVEHKSTQSSLLAKPLSLITRCSAQKTPSERLIVLMKAGNTQSQTKRTISVKEGLEEDVIDQLLMVTKPIKQAKANQLVKSVLTKHYLSTGHIFADTNFKILVLEQYRYRLLVKDSLLIRERDPKLNGTERSLPLYICLDGLTNTYMAISKRDNPTTNTSNIKGINHQHIETSILNFSHLDPSKRSIQSTTEI